jgi:hypothetical protein
MTAAFVQSSSGAGSSTTLGSNAAAGNCLIACVQAYGASSVSKVTLGGSNDNWSSLITVSGGGQVIAVWLDPDCNGSASNVAFTASDATIQNIFAFEFSGMGNAPALSVTPASSLVTTVPNTTSWASGTTASAPAGTVQIGMLAGNSSSLLAISGAGSPWNSAAGEVQRVSSVYGGLVADYQIPGSAGTVSYSATTSTNQAVHAGIALALTPGSVTVTAGSALLAFTA